MASARGTWIVHPHGAIEKISSRVWRVEGDVPGMPLRRVMTVVRMTDGRLVVHNAVALEEAAMQSIDAWGKVAFILVPNGFHRIDAAAFAKRYPDASVLCPAGALKKVLAVVPTCLDYRQFPSDPAVKLTLVDGVGEQEGVMTVEDESGVTLVLTDTVFNMPHLPGAHGFVFKHITLSSGGPRVSRVARLFLVKDKNALAAHLRALADTVGLARVIVGHHEMITKAPADVLRQIAGTL